MFSPYPFERLPKLTRAQARASVQLHSLFADTDAKLAQRAIEQLIGLPLACSVGTPIASAGREVAGRTQSVWIELTLADLPATTAAHGAWLELPFGLCELLIDRALGGDGSLGMLPSGQPIDPLGLGALAYLTARACAAAGPRFRLQAIELRPPQLTDATLIRVAVRVGVLDEAATLHFHVDARLLPELRERARPRALSGVMLTLVADAGDVRVDLATLRSVRAGAALVLDRSRLWLERVTGEFQGKAVVRVLGSRTAIHCRLYGGRLEVESIECSPEASMTSGRRIPDPQNPSREDEGEAVTQTVPSPGASASGAADSVGLARDAPIEVALEIARFQLRLDELERVTPGDVLATGRNIGESVILRAANQAIAEGELVDIDGELGVRITRLLGP